MSHSELVHLASVTAETSYPCILSASPFSLCIIVGLQRRQAKGFQGKVVSPATIAFTASEWNVTRELVFCEVAQRAPVLLAYQFDR